MAKIKSCFTILAVAFALTSCGPKYADNDICDGNDYSSPLVPNAGCPLPGTDYDDIEDWSDNGQFDYKETFFGYWMVGINAKYKECSWNTNGCVDRITIKLKKGKGLSNKYDHKMATVSNIKKDLSIMCGKSWESLRATQKFPQISKGGLFKCDFEDNIKNNTYDITLY